MPQKDPNCSAPHCSICGAGAAFVVIRGCSREPLCEKHWDWFVENSSRALPKFSRIAPCACGRSVMPARKAKPRYQKVTVKRRPGPKPASDLPLDERRRKHWRDYYWRNVGRLRDGARARQAITRAAKRAEREASRRDVPQIPKRQKTQEEKRAAWRDYYAKHRDARAKAHAKWYKANRTAAIASVKAWQKRKRAEGMKVAA